MHAGITHSYTGSSFTYIPDEHNQRFLKEPGLGRCDKRSAQHRRIQAAQLEIDFSYLASVKHANLLCSRPTSYGAQHLWPSFLQTDLHGCLV